jgi:hypothetical protein
MIYTQKYSKHCSCLTVHGMMIVFFVQSSLSDNVYTASAGSHTNRYAEHAVRVVINQQGKKWLNEIPEAIQRNI